MFKVMLEAANDIESSSVESGVVLPGEFLSSSLCSTVHLWPWSELDRRGGRTTKLELERQLVRCILI